MNTLPTFRRMIKAIGNHVNQKETAYRYELIEFQPNGRFIVRPAVLIKGTEMRADGDRSYEMQCRDGYCLLSELEFKMHKRAWDKLRVSLGYTQID